MKTLIRGALLTLVFSTIAATAQAQVPDLSVELLTPASDLVTGADGVQFDLIFGRGGNDVFYSYDPIADANAELNIDVLFGDLFDNTAAEFQVLLDIQAGDPFAILKANIPSVGKDRFVLGDEFQPYYTASNPLSLFTTDPFGLNEFSVIYDFDPSQDTIQLNGKKDNYALLKIDSLPFQGSVFSGYGLFSLQNGLPDLVSLIVEKPSVNLNLKDKYFQFVGNKPKDKPQDKKIGQFGTTGLDFGYGVATDFAGSTYVTGSTSGSLFGPNKGSGDAWLAKYDASGKQLLGLQLGSSGGDTSYKVVTDKFGNFYLAGTTGGSFVAGQQSTDGTDAWVAKYSSNGTLLWGRQVGESNGSNFGFSTSGFGLQVDDGGNVYLSGLTIKDNTLGVLDFPVQDDSFVIKFDSSGSQKWSTQIKDPKAPPPLDQTPFFDESYDLAVDKSGNSYLVGWTQGLSKEADPGRDLLKYDAWLSKVDASGVIQWTQQFGSSGEPGKTGLEFAWGVDTDSQGNIYVTGWTTGVVGAQNFGSYDVFLTKFDPNGNQIWAKQVGTKGDDGQFQSDIVIDANDNIFVSGYTNDKLGSGSSEKSYNAWVGKFDTNGNNKWIQLIGVKDKDDNATGLAVNNNGQVVVTGYTEGFLGSGNTSQTQGAAIDAWVAQLDVEKGKLQNFIGNTGDVINISNPVPVASIDISSKLVTANKLPDGDNVIKTPGGAVDYGKLYGSLASAFDPQSLQTALKNSKVLDTSMLNSTTKVDYKGTDKDDFYFGGSADDQLSGGKGIDVLYGLGGNDKIDGGEGDDALYGGTGNDEVKGGKGMDILTGVDVDPNTPQPGVGEIDKLQGNEDADVFVLGDKKAFYVGNGNTDYALIDDFKLDQGDKIKLVGSPSDYKLMTDIAGLPKGTAIFANGDLIGIVKDVKGLSLSNKNVFTFE
ncbi:MAG: SBBP repeat-containing protein [Gloeobacterales cyanobacterium]